MREKVLEILQEVREDIDFEKEGRLVDDGILESIDIVTIIAYLCDEFNIEIQSSDIIAENFNSLDAITSLMEKLSTD